MMQMLEKAFCEAAKLPVSEQDVFARWLLGEIESERRWKQLFAESQDVLGALALEALEEDARGRTEMLDEEGL